MILYPTETVYGLGVNALDLNELTTLFTLKGRESAQVASWLVRDTVDIERYAEMSETARRIAETFLPGPLTLVLPVKSSVPTDVVASDGTIGFRVSSDPIAAELIEPYMEEHDAPLTCTSANVHGEPTLATPAEILEQFGGAGSVINEVIDGGVREGTASSVVRVIDTQIDIIRAGAIAESAILKLVHA